jgi:hypothetical protein
LPINDLLCENRGTAGRIGEVGLEDEVEELKRKALREAAAYNQSK